MRKISSIIKEFDLIAVQEVSNATCEKWSGGPEICYSVELKSNEFAQLLGVDRVTVSRWENEHEKPSRPTDRLVRLTYAVEAKIGESVTEQLRRTLRKEDVDSKMDFFVSLPLAS